MKSAVRHLDANTVVDYSRARFPSVGARFEGADRLGLAVSVVVVGELKLGAEKTGERRVAEEIEAVLKGVRRVPIDEVTAERYARLRADLERIGQRMDGNDLWMAASALVEGAILVTADEAFARVPGLVVENWRV